MTSSELVPASEAVQPPERKVTDMRALAMSLPVGQMLEVLNESGERRMTFRGWIKAQLRQGIHFGYPPGCEPKFDDNGNVLIWMKGGYKPFPLTQWTPKESLYAAGADFICDLLGLRDAYEADMDGWRQLGEPKGTFVYSCKLFSRSTGELISEGRGIAKVGDKSRDENSAIKMAKKSAKVDSVLNAYGLRDLFTQDLENLPGANPNENPARAAAAPRANSRAERKKPVTIDEVKQLVAEFGTFNERPDVDAKTAFAEFVFTSTGMNFDVGKTAQWTRDAFQLVQAAIAEKTGGLPPEEA